MRYRRPGPWKSPVEPELFIGAMSGTSLDGVDAVLAALSPLSSGSASALPVVRAAVHIPYADALRQRILALCQGQRVSLGEIGEVDQQVAQAYAQAVLQLLKDTGVAAGAVRAIGAHGQTVHHQPLGEWRFSTQLGDPNALAVATGITVVADFRRRDMALGGQGAPLAPGFHDLVLRHPGRPRVVLNCGGIANISVLLPGRDCLGYDTGPANILLDAWIEARQGARFDRDGQWAAQGQVHRPLLQALQSDPYFALPPPKSSGREHFNLGWLLRHLERLAQADQLSPPTPSDADVQRTLLELSASTVAQAVQRHADEGELLVCGGGARNALLMARLAALLPRWTVSSTAAHGIEPEHVEALAFACFAQRTLQGLPGNLPQVTGASRACILGGIYPV